MSKPKLEPKNVYFQAGKVSLEDREAISGHKGLVVWLTGLPASGKSTIARTLERQLIDKKMHAFVLDGDNIRQGLNVDLGFSPDDRTENIRRIGEVAKLFMEAGTIAIVSFISPYRSDRDKIRQIIKAGRFIEVFVDCPVAECERRDPKGLYAKARAGVVKDFTGVSSPYEPPLHPEIHLKTDQSSIEEEVEKVLSFLCKQIH